MRAAIYARKSKDTEQGESMDSQINRCIDVCKMREWEYVIYEDFNISGATLDRPAFTNMMNDVRSGKIKNIVCYKLDRISRSVNDFSNLIEELNSIDVGFICLKEQFDTSTPKHTLAKYRTITIDCVEETLKTMNENTVGERVRKARVNKGMMVKELAAKCGVHPQTITNIEKGVTLKPSQRVLKGLSIALDVSIEYIIEGSELLQ